jgi:predicted metal-dependent enzyme (double-stranded beta helix superfamily)
MKTLEDPTIAARIDTLSPLVRQLRRDLAGRPAGIDAATRAAECLVANLPTVEILAPAERLGDPTAYQQRVLFVDQELSFSLVALVWRPGQRTAIHDHRCWGAVAVLQGVEHETLYRPSSEGTDAGLRPGRQTDYPAGDVSAFAPPGDIHRVDNPGPGTAISLHVYGADISVLGSSIRRTYADDLVAG